MMENMILILVYQLSVYMSFTLCCCGKMAKPTVSFSLPSSHIIRVFLEARDVGNVCVSVLECCWRDCGHEQNFQTFMELQRHVYFHGFHTRLKSIGASLSSKNALPACQFDSSNRNNLPELPDQLRCCWDCCDVCFLLFIYMKSRQQMAPVHC